MCFISQGYHLRKGYMLSDDTAFADFYQGGRINGVLMNLIHLSAQSGLRGREHGLLYNFLAPPAD